MADAAYACSDPKPLYFVEAVLKRPTMYTRHGTYWELVSFINGYYMRVSPNPYDKNGEDYKTWYDWLLDHVPTEDPKEWIWDRIYNQVDTDEEAVQLLRDLYKDFELSQY